MPERLFRVKGPLWLTKGLKWNAKRFVYKEKHRNFQEMKVLRRL